MMSLIRSNSGNRISAQNMDTRLGILVLLGGAALAVILAYLAANEQWLVGLVLLCAFPIFILLHRRPFWGLLLWLLLTPFMVESNILPRNVFWIIHRALPIVMLGLIVTGSILGMHKRPLPRPGWAELAMFGYILISLLSIVYSNQQVAATSFLLYDRVVIPMCLYFLVRILQPTEKEMRWLLPVLIFILISQSIIGMLSWLMPQILPSVWLSRVGERTTGSLGSYSVFTATMAFCGVLLLHSARTVSLTKKMRLGFLLLFVLAFFMIFFSFSRGSWLAGLIVLAGVFFFEPKLLLRLGLSVVVVLILFQPILPTEYIEQANRRFYSEQSEESALSRLPIFYAAYRMFEAKPLFGWGYDNFDRYDRQFQERVGDLVNATKDHASHNVYLTVLAEQGIVGFSLYMAPVLFWFFLSLKVWRNIPAEGFWSRKLLFFLWLIIIFFIVVNNFSNMRVVFGLGLWWITLALIGNMVYPNLTPRESSLRILPNRSSRRLKKLSPRPMNITSALDQSEEVL